MQGVLQITLAAMGYILVSILPATSSHPSQSVISEIVSRYVYEVKENETLTDIAEKHYGSPDYWTVIWNDNEQIKNPGILTVGEKLSMRYHDPLFVEHVKPEKMAKIITEPVKPLPTYSAFTVIQETTSEVVSPSSPSTVQPAVSVPASGFDEVYKLAGEKFGVPWQVLYGLHLTETGQRDGEIYNKSGSGAQGPMQFMPGTWRAYGVDGNGDGIADINNAVDAIHGAANYLAKHGTLDQGLRSYGGNTSGTLAAARERGYTE